MKLTPKIILLFLLLALVPLMVNSVISYEIARREIEANTIDRLEGINTLKAAEIDRWLNTNARSLRELAQRPLVRQFTANLTELTKPLDSRNHPDHLALLDDHLAPTLRAEGGFKELFIIRASDGLVLISTTPEQFGKYRENEPYFIEGKQGTVIQNVYYALSYAEPLITISTPIRDDAGEVVAVVAGHIDLEEVNRITRLRINDNKTEETYLVNTSNFFISKSAFIEDVTFRRAVHTEGVNACLQGEDGSGIYQDYRGVPVIGVYQLLPRRDFCILTEIDQAEALASTEQLQNRTFWLALGTAVLIIIAGVIFARGITHPIRRLVKGTTEIGQGNLEHQIPVKSRDEIGQLAQAFNEMTVNLRHSLDETAHGRQLVTTLSEAAEAVQRVHTPEEIFQTISAEVSKLNFSASIFTFADDGQKLKMPYLDVAPHLIEEAEEMIGININSYQFPVQEGGLFDKMLHEKKTVFFEPGTELIAETLPLSAREFAPQLAAKLGIQQAIVSRLGDGAEVIGFLVVTGDDLKATDVPAISTFANQISAAVENARLIEQLRRHRDELEQLVAERAADLKQSEARYRALAESSPDMIFLIDQDDRVVYVNDYAAQQFNHDPEAIIGQPRSFLFPSEITIDQHQALQYVFRTGEPVTAESHVPFTNGEMWLHTRLVPMTDDDGEVTAVLGVSRDITSMKQAELNLAEKARDLERSNAELEQFAYVASHDLQEPLRMVTSYLQLLERRYKTQLDQDAHDFIEFAVDGATRMKRLINDLLAFSRVGTRGKELAPIDMDHLLAEVQTGISTLIAETNATITTEPLPTVMGDDGQLKQLLQNLISNAIKFRNNRPPVIHIGAEKQDKMWRIEVSDNGIGIDLQYADRIFTIFERLHTNEKYPGTGIGLAICKKIVERHNGRIWVDSQPGQGSTFYFTLPAANPPPAPVT